MFTACLDHELGPDEVAEFKSHLAACAECSSEWEAFQKTLQWIKAVEPVPAPPGIVLGIHEKLEQKSLFRRVIEQLKQAGPVNLSLSGSAAAIVAVLLTVTFMKANNQSPVKHPVLPGKMIVAENTEAVKVSKTVPASAEVKSEKAVPSKVSPHPVYQHRFATAPYRGHSATTMKNPALSAGRTDPGVNFVSLGPDSASSGKPRVNNKASHNGFASKQFSPDITVTVDTGGAEQYASLFHEIMDEEKWKARMVKDDILLIVVKHEDLSSLRQLLTARNAVFSPAEAGMDSFSISKNRMLMVAVRIQ